VFDGEFVPMPTLPAEFTYKLGVAAPAAVTEKGFNAEPLAVETLSKVPVPVLEVVSVRLNRFAVLVVAP
jgi:hypothetical protein